MNKPVFLRRYGLALSAVVVAVLLLAALLLATSAQSVSRYPSGLADTIVPPSAHPLPESADSSPVVWPQARVESALRSSPVIFFENLSWFDPTLTQGQPVLEASSSGGRLAVAAPQITRVEHLPEPPSRLNRPESAEKRAPFSPLGITTRVSVASDGAQGDESPLNSVTDDGLVAHWSFDNCDATDDSRNGHDGAVHGNPECGNGIKGKALRFDGMDDYIQVGLAGLQFNPNTQSFSLVAWGKPIRVNDRDGSGGGCNLEEAQGVPFIDTYRYWLSNMGIEGKRDFWYQGGAQIENPLWDGNNWHLFVGVWKIQGNKANAYYYVDGELKAQNVLDVIPNGSYPWYGLYIGTTRHCTSLDWSFGEFYADEFRIYNRAITDQEVQDLYNVPASQGSLRLIAASSYTPAQPIAATVRVDNPTGTANAYTVTVSLLQGGATLDSLPWDVTVPGGVSETRNFSFGTWPAGSYRLQAELRLRDTLLSTKEVQTGVVSDDQGRALRWVDMLTRWADVEFKQGADLVVDTNVDSLSRMGSELANYLFGKLLTEWIGVLGRAIGMGNDAINGATSTIDTKLLGFKELVAASYQQLRPLARQKVDAYLAPERQKVENKRQVTADFLRSHDFYWSEGLATTLRAHGDAMLNVVEAEPISRGILPPPRFIGTSTLAGQRASWEFYDLYGRIWSALALAAAVAVILIAVFASAGTLAAAIPGFAALRGHASLIAVGVTGLLGLIAIGMDLNFERVVAPAITRGHARALDLFQTAGQMATGASFHVETSVTQVEGREVSLATNLENTSSEEAQPLVETYLYSPDGRVVRIISAQPVLRPGQHTLVHGQAVLPRGSYRAISAIHTKERFGLISQVQAFEVTGPQVQLDASLADTQLSPGEALHAAIFITNTNPLSSTGDVAIIATSTDEQNFNTWVVNLGPGASQRLGYSFVPQAAGSYVLQVNATDGYELLARRDAAYIVGSGPSLALNYSARSIYNPGITVTFPITATNAGNLLTSTVLSMVTLDRLHDLTTVYTDTLSLSVDAGTTVTTTATALPFAQAQPGLYTARLLLGDDLYTSLDFAVAAEDTLFADIYPDTIFPVVSDTVTLTVQVMNSVYTYTDALVDVSLWQPDGITRTVAMNSIGTGQYQGSVTAPITGTYLATVEVSKPNYRAIGNSTFFVAGQHSQLLPTVDGRPILGTTQPVTLTVLNEHGVPIVGASLVVSGTLEYLSRQTDAAGQAVLHLSPTITEPYQVNLEKLGFAQTVMDLPVWIAPDTTPPPLFLDVPSITNHTPLTVTGLTEAGAGLTVNSQAVAVDAQGRFTTTLALGEGANLLEANATDAVSNTTTVTRTVTLDTAPPALTVTDPIDGLFSLQEVISVTGNTEVGASLTVSGTLATVGPASGDFSTWMLLQPGVNIVPVTAADEAGNTTTITRSLAYSCVFGDFDGNWQVDAADLQAVATHWRKIFEPLYDLDSDGYITVADVMRVATRWGDTCP